MVAALWGSAQAQEFAAPEHQESCKSTCAPGINYLDWAKNPNKNYGLVAHMRPKSEIGIAPLHDLSFNFHNERKSKFDGSNLLFMIMGVGGIGAAIAFGGGGGSSKKSAPPMTVTVAPPTTLAIQGYQIQQGTSYVSTNEKNR